MLDIIKYSSWRFRETEGQCIPRGPSFRRANVEVVRLPQCTVEFRAPRHSPRRQSGIEQYRVRTSYTLERTSSIGSLFMPSGSWEEVRICSRNWAFWGPWFTGYMGDVSFSMDVMSTEKANPRVNLLYPAALESAIQGFLTAFYGHEVYDKDKLTPYLKGPLNWTPLKKLPVPAVQLDVEEVSTFGRHQRYVFIPVSRDRLLTIQFDYGQSCAGNWKDKDAKISPKPMLDLIQNIISSIRLTPSPELQAEIDKARGACKGSYSVSAECQPFKWPADVDKDGLTILEYRKDRYKA